MGINREEGFLGIKDLTRLGCIGLPRREVDGAEAALTIFFRINLIGQNHRCVIGKHIGAVSDIELCGKASNHDLQILEFRLAGVEHQSSPTVDHIHMNILGLADAIFKIDHLTSRKQTGLVGCDMIILRQSELGCLSQVAAFECRHAIAGDIGHRQVTVLTTRHADGVTHLVGIHLVLFVVQTGEVALSVVEREIQVAGIVSEHRSCIILQGLDEVGIGPAVELVLEFDGQIGHQMQVVMQHQVLKVLTTVAQVIVDD